MLFDFFKIMVPALCDNTLLLDKFSPKGFSALKEVKSATKSLSEIWRVAVLTYFEIVLNF